MVISFSGNYTYAQEKSFQEIRKEARSLSSQGNDSAAIALLQNNRSRFTKGFPKFIIYYYLGLLYLDEKDSVKAFQELNAGLDKGYFYSIFPDTRQQIQQYSGGENLLSRNKKIRQEATDTTSSKVQVMLSEGYESSKKYPLIVFMHGNNGTLSSAMSEWKNVVLNDAYIVAFIQSSSPISSFAYNWPDIERSLEDIRKAFKYLQNTYSIDKTRVIIAGFSAGGRMAIDSILRNTIPAIGFIAFCPPKPQSFEVLKIQRIKKKGYRGAIISGENDYLLTDELYMADQFKQLGFPLRVVIHSDQEHEYPGDFEYQLNRSLEFILDQK